MSPRAAVPYRGARDQRSAPTVARVADVVAADAPRPRCVHRDCHVHADRRAAGPVCQPADHVPAGPALRLGAVRGRPRHRPRRAQPLCGVAGRRDGRSGPAPPGAVAVAAAGGAGEDAPALARDRLRRRAAAGEPVDRGPHRGRVVRLGRPAGAAVLRQPHAGWHRQVLAVRGVAGGRLGGGGPGGRGRPGARRPLGHACDGGTRHRRGPPIAEPAPPGGRRSSRGAARDQPGGGRGQRRGRAAAHRARSARRRTAAAGGPGRGPWQRPRAARDRPRGRARPGGGGPRGGQGRTEGDPRPGTRHPSRDPRGPGPRRRPLRHRGPRVRAGPPRHRRGRAAVGGGREHGVLRGRRGTDQRRPPCRGHLGGRHDRASRRPPGHRGA